MLLIFHCCWKSISNFYINKSVDIELRHSLTKTNQLCISKQRFHNCIRVIENNDNIFSTTLNSQVWWHKIAMRVRCFHIKVVSIYLTIILNPLPKKKLYTVGTLIYMTFLVNKHHIILLLLLSSYVLQRFTCYTILAQQSCGWLIFHFTSTSKHL